MANTSELPATINNVKRISKKLSDEETSTKYKLVSGPVSIFKCGSTDFYVHKALFEHRCPESTITAQFQGSHNFFPADEVPVQYFLLWLYHDSWFDPYTSNTSFEKAESIVLQCFVFAVRNKTYAFVDFLNERFAEFARAYYRGDKKICNPSTKNMAYVYDIFDHDSFFVESLIEQYTRSLLFRNAYDDEELDGLVVDYPELSKAIFKAVRDLDLKSPTRECSSAWVDDVKHDDIVNNGRVIDNAPGGDANGVSVSEPPSSELIKKEASEEVAPIEPAVDVVAYEADGTYSEPALGDSEAPTLPWSPEATPNFEDDALVEEPYGSVKEFVEPSLTTPGSWDSWSSLGPKSAQRNETTRLRFADSDPDEKLPATTEAPASVDGWGSFEGLPKNKKKKKAKKRNVDGFGFPGEAAHA